MYRSGLGLTSGSAITTSIFFSASTANSANRLLMTNSPGLELGVDGDAGHGVGVAFLPRQGSHRGGSTTFTHTAVDRGRGCGHKTQRTTLVVNAPQRDIDDITGPKTLKQAGSIDINQTRAVRYDGVYRGTREKCLSIDISDIVPIANLRKEAAELLYMIRTLLIVCYTCSTMYTKTNMEERDTVLCKLCRKPVPTFDSKKINVKICDLHSKGSDEKKSKSQAEFERVFCKRHF